MQEIKQLHIKSGKLRTFIKKPCEECETEILVLKSEVKRGGGKVCSRICYYKYQKRTRPREEKSWAWKGDNVGVDALHDWVKKHLGRPKVCDHCGREDCKKYEWANKSGEYKRDLSDWLRLCTKCHAKHDYPVRSKKWSEAVRKLGWNVKKIK